MNKLNQFVTAAMLALPFASSAAVNNDKAAVAALDTQYQAAVEANDAATMDRILADDFILVLGNGKTYTKADLLRDARTQQYHYEHQQDSERNVRVWGDTAVVTALLSIKATHGHDTLEDKLWFSDVYVRTPHGWRYVFGQASLHLPTSP
jgi:ketosteroid isomerase-like protein